MSDPDSLLPLTVPEQLRRMADEIEDIGRLRLARELDALADAHRLANTEPGRPVPPEACDRWRGLAFRLRQSCSVETEVATKLREEARRLQPKEKE